MDVFPDGLPPATYRGLRNENPLTLTSLNVHRIYTVICSSYWSEIRNVRVQMMDVFS